MKEISIGKVVLSRNHFQNMSKVLIILVKSLPMYLLVLYIAFTHSNCKKGKTHNKHACEENELLCLKHDAIVTEGH